MKDEFFEIYFSDLNEAAQKRLMKEVGINHPAEMNWDINMCPIALYPLPFKSEKEINAYLEGLKSLWDAD